MARPAIMENITDFGKWLDEHIEDAGLNIKSLGIKAGVAQSSISQIRHGIHIPSRDMVKKLAIALSDSDADDSLVKRRIDSALMTAGYLPEYSRTFAVQTDQAPIYQSIAEALYVASQNGALDEAGARSIEDFIAFTTSNRNRARGVESGDRNEADRPQGYSKVPTRRD
jgi:transcriptional regulator with XRE-family HTH domain